MQRPCNDTGNTRESLDCESMFNASIEDTGKIILYDGREYSW